MKIAKLENVLGMIQQHVIVSHLLFPGFSRRFRSRDSSVFIQEALVDDNNTTSYASIELWWRLS